MRLIISLLFGSLMIVHAVWGQQTDSVLLNQSSLKIKGIGIPFISTRRDTVSGKNFQFLNKIDSVNIIRPNKSIDGTRNVTGEVSSRDSLINAETRINQVFDSIKPIKFNDVVSEPILFLDKTSSQPRLSSYNHKIDSLKGRLTSRIDSLRTLKVPDVKMIHSLDSMRGKLDSLKNSGVVKDFAKAEKKLAGIESSVTSKLGGVSGKINGKLKLFNDNGGNAGHVNIPGVSGVNTKLPGIKTPPLGGVNSNLPGINTAAAEKSLGSNASLLKGGGQSNLGGTSLPGSGTSLNTGSPGLPNVDLGGISPIQKEGAELTKATGQIGEYQKEASDVLKGDMTNTKQLSKDLEGRANGIAEVGKLQSEVMTIAKQKALIEKWNSDPEYKKELLVTQAKEQALNHFAGHDKELMAAMNQLNGIKSKLKDREQVADLIKKSGLSIKSTPRIERIRPGFNVQPQFGDNVTIDLNPQVGYRISWRFTAGAGWNERIGFNSAKRKFGENERVYGPRAYFQFKIKEGYFAMANVDLMNTFISSTYVNTTDPQTRQWVWGYMAGMKKEFRYSNRLLGNVQILYNIYDPHHQSPYSSRINIRMGIEFPFKKKAQVVNDTLVK